MTVLKTEMRFELKSDINRLISMLCHTMDSFNFHVTRGDLSLVLFPVQAAEVKF